MSPTLKERLKARVTPEKVKTIARAYELRFVGEDERWYLDLTGNGTDVMPEQAPSGPVCSLGLHEEDLVALLDGKTRLKALFMDQRFRVFGDVGDAMRLEALFAA